MLSAACSFHTLFLKPRTAQQPPSVRSLAPPLLRMTSAVWSTGRVPVHGMACREWQKEPVVHLPSFPRPCHHDSAPCSPALLSCPALLARSALESDFVSQLVASPAELEPLADLCRRVLVWHKHAEDASAALYPEDWRLVNPALTRLEGRKKGGSRAAAMRVREQGRGERRPSITRKHGWRRRQTRAQAATRKNNLRSSFAKKHFVAR